MNGIDISSWQSKIDLTKVPCDFVIVKATQGTSYTNPDFIRAIEQGLNAGKCMGIYHYAGGGDPTKEANFFLKTVKPYIGKAILSLDWESAQNPAFGVKDLAWVKEWISVVTRSTNVTPFLYISSSRVKWFSSISDKFKLWAAQYPDYNDVNGYLENPWNEGAFDCVIRQYTSCGHLPGWGSRLDFNKAYITKDEWQALARGKSILPSNPSNDAPQKTVKQLAQEVIDGKWGNGDERRERLTIAGYDYTAVQNEVNILVAARDVIAGKYGNGVTRMVKLKAAGYDYQTVQNKVNELLR